MESKGKYESPRGKAMREGFREEILAVALKNARARFFIPSTDNSFCGIKYDFVMIDSGCNSMLLPFPSNANDLRRFEEDIYTWQIYWPRGTGAVHSPTLVISRIDGLAVGNAVLAGWQVIELPFPQFQLGSLSAQAMVAHERLDEDESAKLDAFLLQPGPNHVSPERQHVLIGQTVLSKTHSLQAGKCCLL